jgi:hypothetical protein
VPYVLSRAIDDGLVPGDLRTLSIWALALLGVGGLSAWLGIMRHRTMSRVRMDANVRTVRVIVEHAVRLGASLRGRIATGEVAAIGFGDVSIVSRTLTVAAAARRSPGSKGWPSRTRPPSRSPQRSRWTTGSRSPACPSPTGGVTSCAASS